MGESHFPRSPRLTRPHCFPALSTEGIFRRSANTQIVREVQQKYNMGERPGPCPGPQGVCVDGGGAGDMCVTVRELLCLRLPSKQGSQILFLSEISRQRFL